VKHTKLVLWQGGQPMAAAYSASYEQAWNEMAHYIFMYEQDGPVRVKAGNKVIYATEYQMPQSPGELPPEGPSLEPESTAGLHQNANDYTKTFPRGQP
jgi:hypothetical protein